MSFPKISRRIEKDQETVKVQFLTESLELILNKEKCVGCGTCARVCPKEAVSRGPIGASRRFPATEDIIPEVYDPKKCVFCGTCVIMCPFSALTLKKDGEVLNLEDIPIVAQHVVPKLEFKAKKIVNHNNVERVVKQYATASVSINNEECAGGCQTCAEVCPSSAIIIGEKIPEKGWEDKIKIELADEEKCVACGACDNACPTGAVKLEIKEINFSGDYNEIFWDPLLERLKTLRWSEKKEE
ncbi:MAG: 4Fe-4S dicluster domain-containing protein [Promethearchaeota archaeon]|nr:MAG: 4Fe-4S dicluster domain-containing protein [Candidatus Lokiarchaeota archaeon]